MCPVPSGVIPPLFFLLDDSVMENMGGEEVVMH